MVKTSLIFASALLACAVHAAHPRYTPVPGGFEIRNGKSEFMRPLYGWHGDDDERSPRKSMPCASDRPKVGLKVFNGSRLDDRIRGVLAFGDGTEDVTFRYVWGRAEYDLAGKGSVKAVRSAMSDGLMVEVMGSVPHKADGDWVLVSQTNRGNCAYYHFERKGMKWPRGIDPYAAFTSATDRVERIARTIEVKTPSPLLDSMLACQLVAADAMFEGRIICHGVTNWRMPFAGWRGPYVCLATGWNDRFKENARLYFKAQSRRSDGRIPATPGNGDTYNMCEVFVDAVLRYWRWSGDDDFMRECAYEGVKKHLSWMEKVMKVPGTDLFENYLNAWNTDDKWCNVDWRLLHRGTYTPRIGNFAWSGIPRTLTANGRSWWEHHEVVGNRRGPGDYCDDWLSYNHGQWSFAKSDFDGKPYAAKCNPVMFGSAAHANVHAIAANQGKELKRIRLSCSGTETFVGLLGVTIYR